MKSRIIGKKQLLSLSLILALGLSVYVNWYYTNNYKDISEPETTENHNLGEAQLVNSNNITSNDEYFSQAKIDRTKSHDEATKHLEDIISNSDVDDETKQLSREKLVNISDYIKTETDIENLLKAQLCEECMVTLNDESIEVVMPKNSLKDEMVVKIKDIILSKTDLSSDKIIIIELK